MPSKISKCWGVGFFFWGGHCSCFLLQAKYVQPLVAVKLQLNEHDYNTPLTIECKVEGSNLRNNDERDKFLGRITFRVHVTK